MGLPTLVPTLPTATGKLTSTRCATCGGMPCGGLGAWTGLAKWTVRGGRSGEGLGLRKRDGGVW